LTDFCRHCRATLRDSFADLVVSPLAKLARALRTVRRECDRPARPRQQSSGRDRQQRRLPAAVFRRGISVFEIEPAENVAAVARDKGIPTESIFFGSGAAVWLRGEGRAADLIVANNVLAHVPDINDFIKGVALLLKPEGLATFEFPHLLRLMQFGQFDTIYHEHFSYISLLAAERIFATQGLRIVDVEELPTHGGSLRVYLRAASAESEPPATQLALVRQAEAIAGLRELACYRAALRHEVRPARVPDRRQTRGPARRRLWSAGQGQHAAELLRYRTRIHRFHRRPQSPQAKSSAPRLADPNSGPAGDR
jgi:hypothetical protein